MPSIIVAPAGYVPQQAIAFGEDGATAVPVAAANPLPVRSVLTAAAVAPLEGSTAAATVAGPFVPVLAREIRLTLSGTWTGTVQFLRSVDGGATKLPLTIGGSAWAVFHGNCNEAVADESEAGATYYLQLTPASGTIAYRVSQ